MTVPSNHNPVYFNHNSIEEVPSQKQLRMLNILSKISKSI